MFRFYLFSPPTTYTFFVLGEFPSLNPLLFMNSLSQPPLQLRCSHVTWAQPIRPENLKSRCQWPSAGRMEVIPETAVASTLVQHPSLTLVLVSFASVSAKLGDGLQVEQFYAMNRGLFLVCRPHVSKPKEISSQR